MARTCCKYFTVSLVPVAALLLAILFALGILSLPILYTELEKKYEYGMVIDAGSSHTTIYIYQIDVPITGDVEEIDHHNMSKSLDSFADSPDGAGKLVELLINQSRGSLNNIKVPKSMHNTTHIYLGATAGMRLLKRTDHDASKDILHAAKTAMKASGFKAMTSRIISGQEEAAGGWLTANYIMNLPEKDLVGSLDLGGGSAEIAFKHTSPDLLGPHHVNVTLRNRTEHLYARSYLCYGHHEAHARFLAHLSDEQHKTANVSNPCLPPNITFNYTASKVFTTCVSNATAQDIFGYTLSPSPGLSENSSVSFVGTGNVEQCWGNISKLFDYSLCDPEVNCDDGTFNPVPANGTLVGYSGFNYIAKHLGISSLTFSRDGDLNLTEIVKSNCTNYVFKNYTDHKIEVLCFSGLFMAHMFEKGFGMNSTSHNNWTLVFKYKEKKVVFGWALGYLMEKTYEFSRSPDVPHHDVWPYTAVDMVIGMIILTILCAIFVVFFFLTFYACKKALKGHNGYQSIS